MKGVLINLHRSDFGIAMLRRTSALIRCSQRRVRAFSLLTELPHYRTRAIQTAAELVDVFPMMSGLKRVQAVQTKMLWCRELLKPSTLFVCPVGVDLVCRSMFSTRCINTDNL